MKGLEEERGGERKGGGGGGGVGVQEKVHVYINGCRCGVVGVSVVLWVWMCPP